MSNRQCTITHATDNRDEPNFKFVDSPIPSEVASDEVLLKVLVSENARVAAAVRGGCHILCGGQLRYIASALQRPFLGLILTY